MANTLNNSGRELSWDDTINGNADEFTLIEPGEYEFQVAGMDRIRYSGSAKLPPCWQAKLKLRINDATIEHNLFLHSKCEGLLCAFFKGIGARRTGERIHMDWSRVIGATGRCVIGTRCWTGKDGQERTTNDVTRFIPAAETAAPPVTPPPPPPVAAEPLDEIDDLPF